MEPLGKLLSSRLISLFKNGQWRKDDVVTLFKALVEKYNGRNEYFHTWMMSILHKVEIHKISASDLKEKENDKMVDHEAKINDIAENNNEKTLDEIVEDICGQSEIDEQTMEKVKDIVLSVSKCLSAFTAPHLQGIKQSLFKLCKAVVKTKGYKPRVTQMVSWCILVLSESSRLVQVLTGEGKSCIVAMFAAHQVMMGKTPDIISSSPVLAERDAEQWSAFYKELEITIAVNTNKPKDEDLKKCYECQVVYGTTQSFAGDFLRQRFQRSDVRPKREFQCVIVDEVDSLMLDKGPEVVYLNSNMPLMEPLNATLAEIWLIVNQLKRLETGEILGPIQLFSEVLSEIMHENKNIDQLRIVQMAVDAGIMPTKPSMQIQEHMTNVLKELDNASVLQMVAFLTTLVRNFPQYFFKLYQQEPDGTLRKQNEISTAGTNKRQEISIVLQGNGKCHVVHFEEDSLVKSLGEMIKNGYQSETIEEQNQSRIPGLQDLINGKMQTWIENALLATKMTLGHEYILHGDEVVPVDYKCTGVVQNNMRWGEGLQQFLEMKQQTKLSNMSLITNFMSNVCLFKKYSDQIYGITGTLGDQAELDMLKKLYNGIKTCKIPSFKQRKLYELEGMVIPEEDEWISTVCNVVKNQVSSTVYRGPRAALVICETINRAEMFHRALAKTITKDKLKLYVNDNMDNSTIIDSKVEAGVIIIATNLAGRGTDLEVCKSVNEAGGLFVVQTFLPLNVRVEQQAFGRTARQGSPGSAQLIVCTSHLSDSVKQVMSLNTPVTSLLKFLSHLTSKLMSCNSTENLFVDALNHYLENRSFQNQEAMVSALTDLLTTKSFSSQDLEEAKEVRNIMVKFRLSRFLEKEIPKITKEENLFSVYLDLLDNVYEDDVFSDQRDVFVSCLHECWGLWFLMYFNEETSIETLKKQLEKDLSNAKQKLLSKQSPSTMVYYYIRSGDNLREKGCFAESIEMYTKALEDGVCWKYIPLCNRALATVMKKDGGYIAKALPDLVMAEKAIDSYKSQLARILTCVKPRSEDKTLLTEQFRVKIIIADLLKTNIQDAVMELKRAESTGGDVSQTGKHNFVLPIDVLMRHASSMEGDGNQPEVIFKRILELKRSIEELKSEFNRNHQTLTNQIKDLNDITDNLESIHKNTTKGSLVGSSIGAAGGITALAGLALAPFTFGASLALTAVGAVAGVAGGVTSGASNITDAVKQKNLRETIEKTINDFQSTIIPMIDLLGKIYNITEKIEFPKETLKQHEFQRAARGAGGILHIAQVANTAKIGKMCAEAAKEIRVYVKGVSAMRATTQTAKAVRATAQSAKAIRMTAAFTGALSVVSLAVDVYSIVQDSTELSEMNQSAHKRNAEEIKSETLKFILQMKETAAHFKISVDIIKQTIDTFKSI